MLSFIGFLVFVGFVGFVLVALGPLFNAIATESKVVNFKVRRTLGLLSCGAVIFYLCTSVVFIYRGDRGAIFNIVTGVKHNVLGEGMHIVPKILNQVIVYDVYTQTWTEEIDCLSKDGLPLKLDVSIRYAINPAKVDQIMQNVGRESELTDKILIPTARSKARDVSALFTAQEAYAWKRTEFQAAYENSLAEVWKSEGYIIPQQILLRKITPPDGLLKKIEETKEAEQEILVQKNNLEAEKFKKEQKIVEAQGDAEKLRIQGNAIGSNPKIINLEWIKKWDGKLPTYMLGDKTSLLMNVSQ